MGRDLKLDLQRHVAAEFSVGKLRRALYRPFCRQWLFFDRILNEEVYQFPQFFPTPRTEAENRVIVVSDHGHRAAFSTIATDVLPDLHLLASVDAFQCFPLYSYTEDGSHCQDNITDWALAQFQATYGQGVSKHDIFHYVYSILHHPVYREHYAENLKRELPRIPLVAGDAAFNTCAEIGRKLEALHVGYEKAEKYSLVRHEAAGVTPNWRVDKMKLSTDRTAIVVNNFLTLSGIPADAFAYRLGNRSAIEWVIDQYQVSEDKRTGIVSDPNRPDDPQYIVRLVGQVVTVSVETAKLVLELTEAVHFGDLDKEMSPLTSATVAAQA